MPIVQACSCILGHDSYFRRVGATVTPPGALAGWPAAHLYDESDGLAWRPPGTSASEYLAVDLGAGVLDLPDYLAVFAHNAHEIGIGSTLASSADGITWASHLSITWTTRAQVLTADPLVAAAPARWWRLGWHGIGSTALRVSEVLLGRRVRIPEADWLGFDPTDEAADRTTVRTEAGHLERSRFLGATRRARVVVPLASRARVEDQDPAVGLAYWWDHVARAGRPTAFSWAAALPGERYRDAFYAHVSSFRKPLATTAREGPRRLELTVEGARPWPRP